MSKWFYLMLTVYFAIIGTLGYVVYHFVTKFW
jgi:hypothetical protein